MYCNGSIFNETVFMKNPFEFRNKDNLVVEFLKSWTNPTYHLEHRYLGLALYLNALAFSTISETCFHVLYNL